MRFDLAYRSSPPWRAWRDDGVTWPEPILSDIEFKDDGNPIIGLRSRSVDIWGGPGKGDVLLTEPARGGGWRLAPDVDAVEDDFWYGEDATGGLAHLQGLDRVVAGMSLGEPGSGRSMSGLAWLSASGGFIAGAYDGLETIAEHVIMYANTGDVEPLCAPPTPTATPTPSSTDTPTNTITPSSSPSPTPTATSTPTALPIYLPLALTESCDPRQVRIDVSIVIDASSSMREPASPGGARTKLEATLSAVGSFLEILDFDKGDQAAIVSFNSDAWLHAGLTADRTVLEGALAAVESGYQTRLDRAVEVGTKALLNDATRAPGNEPVLIVLTDGRANPVPVDVAVELAEQAKADGITLFTIGLGEDQDVEALQQMASAPGFYLHAPTSDDLEGIYAEVARSIPCPPSTFWGAR